MKYLGWKYFKTIIHTLKYVCDNAYLGLKYFHVWNNSPIYESPKNNDLPVTHDIFGTHNSSWQDCLDTDKSTDCYIHFMQGVAVDYSTYIPTPVAMSSAESKTNAGANAAIAMQHIWMLRNELSGLEVDLLNLYSYFDVM